MAETIEPGDRDESPSGTPVTGPVIENAEAAGNEGSPQESAGPSSEVAQDADKSVAAPQTAPIEEELSGFADSVVSGLAQLEIEDQEAAEDQAVSDVPDVPVTAETFFAGWDGLEDQEPQETHPEAHDNPEDQELDLASLRTLSAMGAASAALLSDYASETDNGSGKHDELADAVQAALLSVYGQPAAAESAAVQNLAFPEEALPPVMDRDGALRSGLAPSPEDGLSPQDVILNYFDYSPSAHNGSAHAAAAFESNDGRERKSAPSTRQRPDYARPNGLQGSPGGARPEWLAPGAAAPQATYQGPPSFPVPAPPPAAAPSAAAVASGRESSRFLGAIAIGLIGGIAIAASLAAFMIYGGPHQTGIDIPGMGSLRLDREEQGYGRSGSEDGTSEGSRVSPGKAPVEFTSEVLAADAVTTPGQPVALAISIKSPQPFERTLVSITGVPEGGRLSAGIDAGGGTWLLPPRRLNGLTLNLPMGTAETVPLEVQLLDSNARTPLSSKSQFVVRVKPGATPSAAVAQGPFPNAPLLAQAGRLAPPPAPVYVVSAPAVPPPAAQPAPIAPTPPADLSFRTQTVSASPAQVPARPPFQATLVPGTAGPATESAARRSTPRPEVEDLIREGNKRMREGDILEARQFYQRAVAFGDPEAALAMGRSFDPIYFARIDKKNAEPDAAKAFDWYRRAMDAGAAQTAMVRIENLKHFLNE